MKLYLPEFIKKKIVPLFSERRIALAYLYGSQVKKRIGNLSDIDIAILWQETKVSLKEELLLQSKTKEVLEEKRVDLISLNQQPLSFCYEVISKGICIYGKEEDRVNYEVWILNEYLDFSWYAEEYNRLYLKKLTKKKKE